MQMFGMEQDLTKVLAEIGWGGRREILGMAQSAQGSSQLRGRGLRDPTLGCKEAAFGPGKSHQTAVNTPAFLD